MSGPSNFYIGVKATMSDCVGELFPEVATQVSVQGTNVVLWKARPLSLYSSFLVMTTFFQQANPFMAGASNSHTDLSDCCRKHNGSPDESCTYLID